MIDFGRTASDYARYRVPFAPRLFERLRAFDIGVAGQRIVDVGAGTGLLASGLSERGAHVTCVDLKFEILERSTERAPEIVARVESLPFDDDSCDVVTAAQCWHWFDRHRAPSEILRVLRPDGKVAVIYQTYIPLPDSVAARTEELILCHRPGWRHANSTGVNGQVLRDLQISGFCAIESFSFDTEIEFTREVWRGYTRATSAVGASMTQEHLARFDAEHEALLREFDEPFLIPHRVFAVVARKRV
jgi:SAM-dependent methyltransferase